MIVNGEELYSIGEVSKICNVSKKTLRFYDKIDLISPDYISEESKYRYYSKETLLFVPIIKYYKQMGFKLEEMKNLLDGDTYDVQLLGFGQKIEELRTERENINVAYKSVKDWYNLIQEAESVIENNVTEVGIKFVDSVTTCCMMQEFHHNYRESIINIEWTNHLDEINQAITGAVQIYFPNAKEKLEGKDTKAIIFQRNVRDITDGETITVGGRMMISAYHIGPHDTLNKTYAKIYEWAEAHGYKCGESAIERYVTDYWTIKHATEFVTEILIDIVK
ncbi:MAG: MerR family transcriptional regulator [Bacillota bacterium]|nr:MerR family transcriptional regulator [Bacillota bacterium]